MIPGCLLRAPPKSDTLALRAYRNAFADRLDSSRAYLNRALASSDSTQRLNALVIMLGAGSKIAQAGAYDRAYPWLDQLLQAVAPRTPADTVGPRQQIRSLYRNHRRQNGHAAGPRLRARPAEGHVRRDAIISMKSRTSTI